MEILVHTSWDKNEKENKLKDKTEREHIKYKDEIAMRYEK